MNNVLLISEKTVREYSEISENVWGKSLLPSIRRAQEMYLIEILGSCLYNKLISIVADGSILDQENIAYKDLMDNLVTPYLIERVVAELIPIIGSKIANIGIVNVTDEYANTVSADEVDRLQYQHIVAADHYAKRMQNFLKANRAAYPELNCCQCGDIQPNLNSAEDTGIFLGGYRARIVR